MHQMNIAAMARGAGFALAIVGLIASVIQLRHDKTSLLKPRSDSKAASDPSADQLLRCRTVSDAGKDAAACEKIWSESRRRFFTYEPSPYAAIGVPRAQVVER
jgi:conjugative transfer region protein TrbK